MQGKRLLSESDIARNMTASDPLYDLRRIAALPEDAHMSLLCAAALGQPADAEVYVVIGWETFLVRIDDTKQGGLEELARALVGIAGEGISMNVFAAKTAAGELDKRVRLYAEATGQAGNVGYTNNQGNSDLFAQNI